MATQTLLQPVYVGSTLNDAAPLFRGGSEETWIKEAASQTFPIGALVFLSSGKVTVCTTSSAIFGQAESAGTSVTDAAIRVRVIRPDDIYLMQNNSASTDTTSLTHLGNVYAIAVNSGIWSVNVDTTEATAPSARVKIIGFPDKTPDGAVNTIGDTFGWYYVKFLERSVADDGSTCKLVLQGA